MCQFCEEDLPGIGNVTPLFDDVSDPGRILSLEISGAMPIISTLPTEC